MHKPFRKFVRFFWFLTGLILLNACNPTKKLAPGQYLLEGVNVVNVKSTNQEREEFEAFYRQKPNRKLFRKFHFFVWWYNLFSERKIQEKRVKRNAKYDDINARRIRKNDKKNVKRAKKGKPPRPPKLKEKETPTLRESIRDVGEPAVVFDSSMISQTRFQLSKFLFSKGYFNNTVTDSVKVNLKTRKAKVDFHLSPGKPYRLRGVSYQMDDKNLGQLFLNDTVNSLLLTGMQYDEATLHEEQQRMTDLALNSGYFHFEKAYISFGVDSGYADNTVRLRLRLKKFNQNYNSASDSVVYVDHPRFTIENVYIITQPLVGNARDVYFADTVVSTRKNLKFLLNGPLAYKRKIISSNTDIYPGQYYRKDTAVQTYKQLLGLGIFKNVTIQFLKNDRFANRLDCYIICNPLIKQSLTAETQGTNTYGNLGIDGSGLYQNRNFFKGGELVEFRLHASIIAQKQFNTNDSVNVEGLQNTFNTIEFGPELTFSVPRAFFPFSLIRFRKSHEPRTFIKTALNYQTRPQFNRIISTINYGFNFKTRGKLLRHDLIPFEVYLVRANLTKQFRDSLRSYNDAFLLNSFQDHITTLSRYSITFTSKENSVSGKRTAYYARLNLQSSGNLLRLIYSATNQPKDSLGRYHLFGIPYAHFVKADVDLRMYVPVRKKSRIVYRVAAGIGKPLVNLNVLPYEQSFFSGGPNSVRAWRARTLGPGGYDPRGNPTRFDKIGDLLLEGNIEYRFHMIRSFYGALFMDAGNIWRLQRDESKINGEFVPSEFVNQVAVGGGLGIRWDLTFFVLRLDLAMPFKDPKYYAEKRTLVLDRQPWKFTVANFGIGYPF